MNRIFADKSEIIGSTIRINTNDLRHITKSLRMKDGDQFIVCNGAGLDYLCELCGQTANILETRNTETEPETRLTLFQAVPKDSKMSDIIRMCTELGVAEFVPTITEFGQVHEVGEQKLARWRRTAEEAAKQCNRGQIPVVQEPISFENALKSQQDLILIPYEKETATRIEIPASAVNIGVFIGSEGGFSANEISMAKSAGAIPITLGKRILRTETAGAATAAIIMNMKAE